MNTVLIRGLEVTACHGVHGFEKVTPKKFVFDADIKTNFYSAAKNDDINGTISYSEACSLISEIATNNVYNLIEKLAYECAFSVMEKFDKAEAITLTVYKPEAPLKHKFSSVGVTVEMVRERAYLSLGSSMGDKRNTLDTAIKMLNETRGVRVEKVSDYIKNAPYGGVAKNEFLNCAVCVSTLLTPHNLLDEIHRIESLCGRVRDVRWGDRTLDIDIIFFGDKRISDETLTIPHADYKNRSFVTIPLKQIAPHLIK